MKRLSAPQISAIPSCATDVFAWIGFSLIALLAIAVSPGAAGAAITASSADDICSPTADPCTITQEVDIVSGSLLDFGTRRVVLSGGGVFDVQGGNATILLGELDVGVSGVAIKLVQADFGGLLSLLAYRTCSGDGSMRCLAHTTCALAGAGTCTGGSGDVHLDGRVAGNGEDPGTLLVRAAGDISVFEKIQVTGSTFESDGGTVELEALGSVFVEAKIESDGGGDGGGGEVCLIGGADVIVNAIVQVNGGNFDGGTVEIGAGRDVLITSDLNADAVTGEGFGGAIDVTAGNRLEIVGGGSGNRLLLTTEGHTGFDFGEAFGGDGGLQDYTAGADASVGEFVRFRSNGASPDGYGDDIRLNAGAGILFKGEAESKAKGGFGGGGSIDLTANGDIVVESTARFDVTAGDGGGGQVSLAPTGDLDMNGTVDLSAGNGGNGGSLDMTPTNALRVGGSVMSSGAAAGILTGRVLGTGCTIDILAGADIDNSSEGSDTLFRVAEQLTIAAGASVSSDGENLIEVRDAFFVPAINGSVTPAPIITQNTMLPSCPLCGNAGVDPGETCDDGNVVSGDGCSSDCQNESCIAQTPGYPSVALCSDGNDCTADSCNAATGQCEHTTGCDDGFTCTIDTCSGSTCIHTPDDSLCTDDDVCTNESCSATEGCVFIPNDTVCDDELFCNGADACSGGGCVLHTGDPCVGEPECLDVCNEQTDECRAPFQYPCTPDADECTDDVCNGLGACTHIFNNAPCDDGVFCNGADFCQNGTCSFHAGDPCVGGAECADVCDAGQGACITPEATVCSDDGNICTDDFCDGTGACGHTPNIAPCDDGNLCTVDDQCSGGICLATAAPAFDRAKISAIYTIGDANDRLLLKTSLPSSAVTVSPSDSGVTIELRDAEGTVFYTTSLPAAAIVDSGDRGRVFKFRDKEGAVASANGVLVALLKRNDRKGEVRVKLRMIGYELPLLHSSPTVSMMMLFGSDPVAGSCIDSGGFACRASLKKVSCAG